MSDTSLIALANRLLTKRGITTTRERTVYAPDDADDPGGPALPSTTSTALTAVKLPLSGRDIRSFGIAQVTGREEKFLANPEADLAIGDLITFNGKKHVVIALSEVNPKANNRLLWKGVVQL